MNVYLKYSLIGIAAVASIGGIVWWFVRRGKKSDTTTTPAASPDASSESVPETKKGKAKEA